ncbi:MAG TPA: folate-binding protein [Anaeromyxobacter sp.]
MTLSSAALRAAKDGWAVGPVEAPAVLRATGKDAKDYLHRMTTQDLNALPPGGSAYAAVLNAKGHLLADLHALVEADGVLLIMDPRGAADARPHLEKFVIMDEVVFEDLSATLRVVPVVGPESAARLGTRAATPRRISNRRRGVPALDFVVPVEDAGPFRAELVREGAFELGEGDLEALRILEGQARFGADMDASRLPMEAGLTRLAISFSKGCYTGQEVVLRATSRGHLQRGLVQLELPPGAGAGTPLSAAGQEVGVVTSAADTPEGRLGLGYLRRAHWNPGERVATPAGEAVVRRVLVEDGVTAPSC